MSPGPRKHSQIWTKLLILGATVLFAILPLYLTTARDAVYDGALLGITFAFSADALFRCLNPESMKGNVNLMLAIGALVVLAMALLQYGPIANDLRKEKIAVALSIEQNSILPLAAAEAERKESERNLPNDSLILLISSVVAEFWVIILIER